MYRLAAVLSLVAAVDIAGALPACLPHCAGARLDHASLSGANLSGADLSGASLTSATLAGAVLFTAVLADADLSYSDLRKADLRSADLSGANLYHALVSGAEVQTSPTRSWRTLSGNSHRYHRFPPTLNQPRQALSAEIFRNRLPLATGQGDQMAVALAAHDLCHGAVPDTPVLGHHQQPRSRRYRRIRRRTPLPLPLRANVSVDLAGSGTDHSGQQGGSAALPGGFGRRGRA